MDITEARAELSRRHKYRLVRFRDEMWVVARNGRFGPILRQCPERPHAVDVLNRTTSGDRADVQCIYARVYCFQHLLEAIREFRG